MKGRASASDSKKVTDSKHARLEISQITERRGYRERAPQRARSTHMCCARQARWPLYIPNALRTIYARWNFALNPSAHRRYYMQTKEAFTLHVSVKRNEERKDDEKTPTCSLLRTICLRGSKNIYSFRIRCEASSLSCN